MTEVLFCIACGSMSAKIEDVVFKNGTKHKKATCADCGTFIKFVSSGAPAGEFKMPFGKHKGKRLRECPRDYLVWLSKNIKSNITKRVDEFLNSGGGEGAAKRSERHNQGSLGNERRETCVRDDADVLP